MNSGILSTPPRQPNSSRLRLNVATPPTGLRTRLTPSETPFQYLTPSQYTYSSKTISDGGGCGDHPNNCTTFLGTATPPKQNRTGSSINNGAEPVVNRLVRTPGTNRRYNYHASSTSRHSSTKKSNIGHHRSSSTNHFYTPRQTPSVSTSPSPSGPVYEDRDDDRFIPSRRNLNMDLCRRALLSQTATTTNSGAKRTISEDGSNNSSSTNSNTAVAAAAAVASMETPLQKEFKRRMLSTLCNIPLNRLDEDGRPTGMLSFGSRSNSFSTNSCNGFLSSSSLPPYHRYDENVVPLGNRRNYHGAVGNPFALDTLRSMKLGATTDNDPTILLGDDGGGSGNLSSVASKIVRKVPNAPIRILDAPDIVDDYYLNLISWSKDGILAVALARSVYLWNSSSGDINHLVTVQGVDYITSVCWCPIPGQTKLIAVGTHMNSVHIYDGIALVKVRTMDGATGRIASLSWNTTHNFVSAGDRDACIINHDIRAPAIQHIVSKYRGHAQEVCGLKWNDDGTTLASGGNENYLCLWDVAMSNNNSNRSNNNNNSMTDLAIPTTEHGPRLILKQHKAAVKALDWCPFNRGLLASGGGTADRSIKFWNTSSGVMLNTVDTGSQVCSLLWSQNHNSHYNSREICSSHGYSENQLILWKYPGMTKIKELTGHTARVLNMDISPDGTSVVSAGADETLRFWNLFDTAASSRHGRSGSASMLGELSFGARTIR